ncbi:MAG: bifunctional glycosyltransferase/class I SAM-dependent methyltransferase [Verrucomicrobia bacterium]|nr:bifunctional glycosyltransferase/class I SAM-dependent methyltransferase [Verrucomicrobiota bacterium]
MTADRKPRALIFIVAYYAESTILKVLDRIPALEGYDTEVLLIDDCSGDATYAISDGLRRLGTYKHKLTVLTNPVNQGYGGNQKLGYHYAIEQGFDYVALLHGDAQYAPEMLPDMFAPLAAGTADVVLGSRMLTPGDARKGGMPFYKWVGNKILTSYQNFILRSSLAEFHTGYKAYTTAVLRRIPFELNSNVFHFDTEIIIQFLRARARITEIPIPTHYGNEICRVDGVRYAWDVVNASTVARLQDYGLVYRRNFDVESVVEDNKHYLPKTTFASTHSAAIAAMPAGATVMDIGCGPGHLCPALHELGCRVIGVDQFRPSDTSAFDEFHVTDLNANPFPRPLDDVQVVLILDVIEHLTSPEKFCDELRRRTQSNLSVKIIISTGNISFIVTRLMLFLGQFNYNKRGILDLTHTRLFTFSSLRRLLKEQGFVVELEQGIPAPIPLVVKNAFWQKFAPLIVPRAVRVRP